MASSIPTIVNHPFESVSSSHNPARAIASSNDGNVESGNSRSSSIQVKSLVRNVQTAAGLVRRGRSRSPSWCQALLQSGYAAFTPVHQTTTRYMLDMTLTYGCSRCRLPWRVASFSRHFTSVPTSTRLWCTLRRATSVCWYVTSLPPFMSTCHGGGIQQLTLLSIGSGQFHIVLVH